MQSFWKPQLRCFYYMIGQSKLHKQTNEKKNHNVVTFEKLEQVFFFLDILKYFQIVLFFILPFAKHFITKTSIHPCYLYVPLYMT